MMYKNRSQDHRNNICGEQIAYFRKLMKPRTSQRMLADNITRLGCALDKNAIQRIESGTRFVTDIELIYIAKALGVTIADLIGDPEPSEAFLGTSVVYASEDEALNFAAKRVLAGETWTVWRTSDNGKERWFVIGETEQNDKRTKAANKLGWVRVYDRNQILEKAQNTDM